MAPDAAVTAAMAAGAALDRAKGASRPARVSQSLVRAASNCLLAARMSRDMGDTGGPAATLGSLFHEAAAAVGEAAILRDEERIAPDAATQIARAALARPGEVAPLSFAHHEAVLELVAGWAEVMTFGAAPVRMVEAAFRHDLDGRTISGRVDWLAVDGATATVEDYKTGRVMPPFDGDDWIEDRPQLAHYAWHVFRAYPDVEVVMAAERYVRFGVAREVMVDRDLAARYEAFLRAAVARIDGAWDRDEFPPTPGSWCRWCPAPARCPLPEDARPESIDTREAAEAQAGALAVEDARREARTRALKAFLDREDAETVRVGDRDVGWMRKTERRLDTKALEAAGVDVDAYRVARQVTRWGTRKHNDDGTEGE